MGGHGGLNILPQKSWNVYNYENREKVRKDEEAAAKEEKRKREQARKRDAEFRLERLRTARGSAPTITRQNSDSSKPNEDEKEEKSGHINLFEGIEIFDPIKVPVNDAADDKDGSKRKKMRKEEAPRVVTAEDEKYRLGYGLAGKGVKLPWYLQKRGGSEPANESDDELPSGEVRTQGKESGKKTLEELRAERMKREEQEKERERALIRNKGIRDGVAFRDRTSSRRLLRQKDHYYYNFKHYFASYIHAEQTFLVRTYIYPRPVFPAEVAALPSPLPARVLLAPDFSAPFNPIAL